MDMKDRNLPRLPVREIAPDTYMISDSGVSLCYLLVGTESALLIDCGAGTGDLLGTVREITDLPLTVALTHGHVDHGGGQGQFGRVFVPQGDTGSMYRFQTSFPVRSVFLKTTRDSHGNRCPVRRPVRHGRRPEIVPFGDGQAFPLGNRTVTAYAAPGHTRGSVFFLDEGTGTAFVGDNLCAVPWLFLPDAAPVETWLESARDVLSRTEGCSLWWGHGDGLLDRGKMSSVLSLGEELLRKYPRNTLLPHVRFFPRRDPEGCIVFRTDRVRAR